MYKGVTVIKTAWMLCCGGVLSCKPGERCVSSSTCASNNFTHLVIHLHFGFRCAPLCRISQTYVTWLHLCGGSKTHLSVPPVPSLTLQSAHLVQAAHFLRRVDDLPTAGTLRVHPPNLRGAPTATVHSLPRGVVNVVRTESPTSPRWAALTTSDTANWSERGWMCQRDAVCAASLRGSPSGLKAAGDAAPGPTAPSATS